MYESGTDPERVIGAVPHDYVRRRVFSIILVGAFLLGTGCTRRTPPDGRQNPTDSAGVDAAFPSAVSIRFAIEVGREVEGPIYVVLNEEDDQVGWVKVFREGERVYLRERCEIENCGEPPAVCGMAFRMIRDIAGGGDDNTIEFAWDGMTSVLESTAGCESRELAPPGNYIARFCYSRNAEWDGAGDPRRAAAGRIVEPTCIDRAFTLGDRHVVLRL